MFEGVLNTPLLKNKVGVKCVNLTFRATTRYVNLRDNYFEIFQLY